ncbi:hypothetical protein F4859DRAFT_78230 [Xylaria cf. heliscus]|nr:hypothetical protein F4859DRAFT_78230 [Xylaria cf. heliscus]
MTDQNASSLPRPNSNVPTRPLGRSSLPRSSSSHGSHGSYVTGEPSTAAGQPHDVSVDRATFGRSSPYGHQESNLDPRSAEQGEHNLSYDAHRRRQSHKSRPSSGFLLSNSILNETPKPGTDRRSDGRRRSRIPVDSRKGKSPLRSSEDSDHSAPDNSHAPVDGQERPGMHPARLSAGGADVHDDRPRSQMANRRRSMLPSPRPSSAPLDVDSTQIVSMALDLSESRRLASRRNVSTPIPPRLTQLPDSTLGRSLKQHLQQQRRSSRNISPRAGRNLSPRIVSAPRMASPLQPTFDHDGSYTYHFSSSTLNRAQKAKEYLELMAQYRRLLLFLPPLKQEARSRPSTSTTSNSTSTALDVVPGSRNRTLGRAYNPLQYIRNRKIRTRERQTIDGEAQGFADVPRVTDWIDEVATSTAVALVSESPKLPPFPAADEYTKQQLPASNLPRPVSALNKLKRPRFEWSIDPADMLGDIYWLGQDDNRFLIEDRHYTKIYSPKVEASQPPTQVTEQNKVALVTPPLGGNPNGDGHDMPERDIAQSLKADVETAVTSTRDRARQKLQDLRGLHHKHSNSIYSHHDFLRFRRGSSSESSDDESDRRRRGRTGTISASGQDLLEKQMNEMIAKESQDEQEHVAGGSDANHLKPLPAAIATPEQTSRAPRPGHSRKHSRIIEAADDKVPLNQTPPVHSARTSLEVPNHPYRSSMDIDPSRPPLSDIISSKGHQNGYVPAIGMDLSPLASRPSSPARNPFSKVKSIFRDRSREREDRENDDKFASPIDPIGATSLSPGTEDSTQTPKRPRSKSSTRELIARATHESHKSHRSMGSFSLRPDEQVGLRTIFKGGAKLDDMIRGGVSKMTDLIWKKDSDSDSTDDDSDTDIRRGRPTGSALLSPASSGRHHDSRRPVKNYMDIMPNFKSTIDSDKSVSHRADGSIVPVLSRPPSRSPRFEQLKPPRIDIRRASPDLSDIERGTLQSFMDSDMSELDTRSRDLSHTINRPRQSSKDLRNILIRSTDSLVSRTEDGKHISDHRNWIIPDRASLSQHTLISRREVARLRALILCSGIKAMEISRRANEPYPLFSPNNKGTDLPWAEIRRLVPDEEHNLRVSQAKLFPTAGRILSRSINSSINSFEKSASEFSAETAPHLQHRVDAIYNGVAVDLMDMTRCAADEADEVNHDIVDDQRLKVKSVLDAMDKMLRRRRRRFRWVRRAGWLAVEWVLVGFMWYVWFIVMITRIVLGAGRGVFSIVRWLLWL